MIRGDRLGMTTVLDPSAVLVLGRGADCGIVLIAASISRTHARIYRDAEGWWVVDNDSQNGTFLDGHKVAKARLSCGSRIRIGEVEFQFADAADQSADGAAERLTTVLMAETEMVPADSGGYVAEVLSDPKQVQDCLTLLQLSIRLLSCSDPEEVVTVSLDLLQQQTGASIVGLLWVDDAGELKLRRLLPTSAQESKRKIRLSRTLTERVCGHGRAIWVASQETGDADQKADQGTASLKHYADAICAPLRHDRQTVGAVHVYLERGHFSERDFQMTRLLANLLAVALIRARKEAVLNAAHERLVAKGSDFSELVGDSAVMCDLKSKIARVGRAAGGVLVSGESGTGKELVARALHRESLRSERPMLSVNCAAIPRELMESQLFGHARGAFTGADEKRVGWFEQADSGTLFLDEVGELTLEGQAKLLRVLEGHPFQPVGDTREIRTDVRVIAATNLDLRELVEAKRFREDLYYRLSVFELSIPPLRERQGDIELLVELFLQHFNAQHGKMGLGLSGEARDLLLSYRWPGNVRQLRNVIDSAVVMADGDQIQVRDLGIRREPEEAAMPSLRLDEWEKRLIGDALARAGGSVRAAAEMLGIGRATLYRKIDEYQIER
ncbi:MAG: sigma-54-dependent Fis family transcriptional regulator [Planctomycetaceae bacterium]|nr:sigma-54-dependent Fis family transcriptional regulator [Planctomycetaceae bacterium]